MEQEIEQAQPQSTEVVEDKPQVTKIDSKNEEISEVHPRMHWLLIVIIIGGLLMICAQLIGVLRGGNQNESILIYEFFTIWGVVSLVGILFKKRWALISYFSCRIIAFFVQCIFGQFSAEEDLYTEIGGIMLIVALFFIPKDGHNAYDLLWHNGVFYEKKTKSPQNS